MTARVEREARLAARLRDNLKRRKMSARAGEQVEGQPGATAAACPREDGSPVEPSV